MNLKVLGSSSKGNCYLIEDSGEILILECGVGIKDIKKGVDFDFSNVVGCLVTHEHKDHCKSAKDLVGVGIDIYSSKETLETIVAADFHKIRVNEGEMFKVGGYRVIAFETKHDCENPFGYLIMTPSGKKIVFATDTYYLKYIFSNVDVYMVECNYDIETLSDNINNKRINEKLAKRIMSTHFGLDDVVEFLKATDTESTKLIMLLHLSDNNSNADRYRSEVQNKFNIRTEIAEDGFEWQDEI